MGGTQRAHGPRRACSSGPRAVGPGSAIADPRRSLVPQRAARRGDPWHSRMFQHQGPSRSNHQNRLVAGYLALVGGFVNSAGYLLIGSFTSHVTGNVGRAANDIAAMQFHAAAGATTMIIAFFAGAFAASMAIESDFFRKVAYAYSFALFCEGALLVVFMLLSRLTSAEHPRLQDAEAALLCAAMGMQNSLVTRLSGAVVRTTHLTGVVTDLGIEAARWFRWWRGSIAERVHVRLSFGHPSPEKPSFVKITLLATIAGSFMVGAVAGATTVVHLQHVTMLIPSVGVFACAIYAYSNGRGVHVHAPDSRVLPSPSCSALPRSSPSRPSSRPARPPSPRRKSRSGTCRRPSRPRRPSGSRSASGRARAWRAIRASVT